jgi:dTDP-4-dehydrorhamnose 3,5-epimerase-like enzyme
LVVYDIDNGIKEEFLLSANREEHISILIPPRHLNAHQCLSSECVLHYKWDAPYDLSSQYSVRYNDETIGANWAPIPAILSERDEVSRKFKDAFSYNCESKPTYIAQERY